MSKTYTYQVNEDVLLLLARSLDLMNCAQLIINSGNKDMQRYVMSLVEAAEYFGQRTFNTLDFGEQPTVESEQGGVQWLRKPN